MGVRGFLTLGVLLALAGNVAWWAVDSGDWAFLHLVQYSGMSGLTAFFSLISIWTVEPATRSGILPRSGVIGLHLATLVLLFVVTLPSLAIPPMLVVSASMGIAFARFVRTPLATRI